jgi:hypothetical protein
VTGKGKGVKLSSNGKIEREQPAKLLKNTCANPKNTQFPPYFQLCYPTNTTMRNEILKASRTDERQGKSDLSSIERPGSCFNILSILIVPVGVLIAHLILEQDTTGWGWGYLFWAFIVMAVTFMTGIGFASIALGSNERRPGLTVIALLLNGIPIVFFLFKLLSRS